MIIFTTSQLLILGGWAMHGIDYNFDKNGFVISLKFKYIS